MRARPYLFLLRKLLIVGSLSSKELNESRKNTTLHWVILIFSLVGFLSGVWAWIRTYNFNKQTYTPSEIVLESKNGKYFIEISNNNYPTIRMYAKDIGNKKNKLYEYNLSLTQKGITQTFIKDGVTRAKNLLNDDGVSSFAIYSPEEYRRILLTNSPRKTNLQINDRNENLLFIYGTKDAGRNAGHIWYNNTVIGECSTVDKNSSLVSKKCF